MLLDYLFYHVYIVYNKYKQEGDPLARSKMYLLYILHIAILPISLNIAALYAVKYSVANLIPYAIMTFMAYKYIQKRYNKKKLNNLMSQYDVANKKRIPFFLLLLLVTFSIALGLLLTGVFNLFVMKPLGLIGILK